MLHAGTCKPVGAMRLSRCTGLPSSLSLSLFLWCSAALGSTLVPLQVDFSTEFLGYDGQWSAAQIRVGTSPEQWLQLLPSTTGSETWVVGPGGCDNTPTCTSKRGGIFYWNQSQSWDALGYFDLGYSTLSGTTSVGQYGLDNVSISDTVSLSQQSIAIVNTTSIWLGEFGLGIAALQYNNNIKYSSFLSTLAQNDSLIPSRSYGYTSGAYYKAKSVPGSLTLGGVDTTRFTPNSINFTLSQSYEPVVAITSVQVTSASTGPGAVPPNWTSNPMTLLNPSNAYLATIDSSTPFLWMPDVVCDAFAAALNLTYDENLDLYTFTNNSSPELLNDWGLTFTFTLANTPTSQTNIVIPISYNAFNLQLSYPFPGLDANSTSAAVDYFPLRRANQTSQYTIGRAFLQEAYLTVDYDRNTFSVYPAVFPDTNVVSPNIVAITNSVSRSAGGTLSTGADVGIAVGIVTAVSLVAVLIYVLLKKRRASASMVEKQQTKPKHGLLGMLIKRKRPYPAMPELSGDKRQPKELQADTSNSRFELDGDAPVEMPAEEVSSVYFEANPYNQRSVRAGNDPRSPAELANRQSTTKAMEATTRSVRDRSESPVPAYSPVDTGGTGQTHSDSISPHSSQLRHPFAGSQSSGEQGISPVSPKGFQYSGQRFPTSKHTTAASPVSPAFQYTAPQGGTDTTPLVGSDVSSRVSTSHLAPQNVVLVRTLSHNSRFQEDLSDERTYPTNLLDESSADRQRFSWEEGTTQ